MPDQPLLHKPPGVILAGGRSSRMGRDKAHVLLGDQPLLSHAVARLAPQLSTLAINAPEGFTLPADLPRVPDTLPGQRGPLAGILTALRHAASTAPAAHHVLCAPVDSPFLPKNLVERLQQAIDEGHEIAVAASRGAEHPVCGLFPAKIADALQAFLEGPENPRVKAFLARYDTVTVAFPDQATGIGPLDPFLNVNTPDDLHIAHRYLEAL
ncbi:molybdenum cofactor guanylyltransferase MobA [Rhizobium sp. SGZ-381]|uniref:molybdenum cofactor guanylyltransferase MobA n=1 Tax=Rhizobium sp. SGZ-381 TaxID=3342800 RepID=UPI0036711781